MNQVPRYFLRAKRQPSSIAWYPGGKGLNAARISKFIPKGTRYLEPYCGMISVFGRIKNEEYPIIALNDINKNVYLFLKVLQDQEQCDKLIHRLIYTPYSQSAFIEALDIVYDKEAAPLDKAWAFFVTQNQGFAGIAKTYGHWGRRLNPKEEHLPSSWQKKISNIEWWHEKLMGVYLDNRDSIDFIKYWDVDENSIFYLDPPYIGATRASKEMYRNETDDNHHIKLVETLLDIKGKAVLSCYDHEIYQPLTDAGWHKESFKTSALMASRSRITSVRDGKAPERTETLYIKG